MTLASMTGYGAGKHETEAFNYSCEIKSLNARFLEVNVRLPRGYAAVEAAIIRRVKESLERGKIDVFVDVESNRSTATLPVIDSRALQHYCEQWKAALAVLAANGLGAVEDPRIGLGDLARLEGVLATTSGARDVDALSRHGAGIFAAIDMALDGLKTSRAQEGANLGVALRDLVQAIQKNNDRVRADLPAVRVKLAENFKKRLEAAIEKIATIDSKVGLPPEERMLQELGVLLDKQDIEEEITRLASHIVRFSETMEQDGAIGRKLDFLCQEMHREVNTMSNKAVQTPIADYTIEMKQWVEQVRQQVQNVE